MSTRRAICVHLQPLVDAIAAAHVSFEPTESPYGGDDTWWMSGCTFDEPALRARLALDPCVTYTEYDGHAAGADATFQCEADHIVIMGPHPNWASPDTPRLR